ncbi:MAG: hypothetical protein ACKOGA_03745 [Planctomycetaceae bacterium]
MTSQAPLSDQELLAFLEEALPAHRMTIVEGLIRESSHLRSRLAELRTAHTSASLAIPAVWRAERLSCPTRSEWSAFLIGILPDEIRDYAVFHEQVVGCRLCAANLADLRLADQSQHESIRRQERIFNSSAGRFGR